MTKTRHKNTDRAGRVGSEAENQRANIKNYENHRNSGTMQRPKGPKRFLSALTVCHHKIIISKTLKTTKSQGPCNGLKA